MRIHIPSLPHTQVSLTYEWCAYTMKVRRFARMMYEQSIPMFLYAGELTDDTTKQLLTENKGEDVQVVWPGDREQWFGAEHWPDDWIFNAYDKDAPQWAEMNRRVAQHIAARWQDGDIVGAISGICQESIGHILLANHGIKAPVVEWGIGYTGTFSPYRVFESWAHRFHVTGLQHYDEYRPMDEVIPNAFDTNDFIARTPGEDVGSDGYVLYMGRMTPRKGLSTVQMIASRGEDMVLTAGQGEERIQGATHIGVVRGKDKAKLVRNAKALLAPTTYCEPFGGVAIESMMAGTPSITTDWGGFVENVPDRYRCRSDAEFIAAVETARHEDRAELQQQAWQKFGLSPVSARYAHYFGRVLDHFRSR